VVTIETCKLSHSWLRRFRHRSFSTGAAATLLAVLGGLTMLTVLVFGQQHESSVDWTRTIADVRAGRGGPLVALEADI